MGHEKLFEFYDERARDARDVIATGIYDALYEAVADTVGLEPSMERIIEVGCGSGQMARILWDRGWRQYMGFDFSVGQIELAMEEAPRFIFIVLDVFSAVGRNVIASGDIILMVEVLEHVERDVEIMEMIPSGRRVVFSVPDFDHESHVRHFEDADAVRDRYERYIERLVIQDVESAGHTYFIGSGVKR
jgi:2-polyprenyl-3-methyl-5-hydroxy-6-metoxy-1,4-benzoquinol methylase